MDSTGRVIHEQAKSIIAANARVIACERYHPPTRDVIALDVDAVDDKCFRLLTDVEVIIGGVRRYLHRGFRWNGADIPRFLQWILGIDQHDPRVALASAFHDDECNRANAGHTMRVLGDAIFITLLMPINFNGVDLEGVGQAKAIAMYCGVRLYSFWRFVQVRIFRQ